MATLDELRQQVRLASGDNPQPAGKVVLLEPSAFLEECTNKPAAAVAVGLRTPNSDDYQTARQKETDLEAMQSIVAIGICDPNDCTLRHPAPVFEFSDIAVKSALKPATVSYLFDQIEQLHIETSPIVEPANDDELFLLGQILQTGDRVSDLSNASSLRIRRLATAILDVLLETT